jgi:signal peptidase I
MSRVVRELVEAVALAVIVFLLIQTTVRNFKVDGSSMRPTLEGGQYLLVNKVVYFQINTDRLSRILPFWKSSNPSQRFAIHPPHRGEVIVFRFPEDPSKDFVKRVIGLPGEEVEIRQGKVYINGDQLREPYLTAADNSTRATLRLSDKQYYVLGDNRRSSNDSRIWGPVPEENVLGKVWLVYWPFSGLQLLGSLGGSPGSLIEEYFLNN